MVARGRHRYCSWVELVIEQHRARCSIVVDHKGPGVVEQNFLGYPAKLVECTFEPLEPALLALVAECSDVTTARVAKLTCT
jgi:hypothetical protein